jgi:hypothetical protein
MSRRDAAGFVKNLPLYFQAADAVNQLAGMSELSAWITRALHISPVLENTPLDSQPPSQLTRCGQ